MFDCDLSLNNNIKKGSIINGVTDKLALRINRTENKAEMIIIGISLILFRSVNNGIKHKGKS